MRILNLRTFFLLDKVLYLSLAVALTFCVSGISYKYMHPDQMAFRPLFLEGKLPFNPGWFHKPPFHTYFNYFLSVAPISFIEKICGLAPESLEGLKILWSKILTYCLFLGSVILVFKISKVTFNPMTAKVLALTFATSAGFITYSQFLTADIPVMFWMLLAFYFSHKILLDQKLNNYLFAGFFTGIATATKYNGLAIGITIPVAHFVYVCFLSSKPASWKKIFLSKNLLIGLLMVIVGFIGGNPFSLIDYRNFFYDFIYNYTVTPVYDGQTGNSYLLFFYKIIEIIGIQSFIIFFISFVLCLYRLSARNEPSILNKTIFLTLSVLILYYYKFASFPRLETRFILPIVPFCILLSGVFWHHISCNKNFVLFLLSIILIYNTVCSSYAIKQFSKDPRMQAEVWVKNNIPENSFVESDIFTPSWNDISGVNLKVTTMPFVNARERLFDYLFPNNSLIVSSKEDIQRTNTMIDWFSLKNLLKRNPDYIAIDSLYYERFIEPSIKRDLYPSIYKFFEDLLQEKYPYQIVFDKQNQFPPIWVYPRHIDFLQNRIVILAKKT